jgi:hypothetical protein
MDNAVLSSPSTSRLEGLLYAQDRGKQRQCVVYHLLHDAGPGDAVERVLEVRPHVRVVLINGNTTMQSVSNRLRAASDPDSQLSGEQRCRGVPRCGQCAEAGKAHKDLCQSNKEDASRWLLPGIEAAVKGGRDVRTAARNHSMDQAKGGLKGIASVV